MNRWAFDPLELAQRTEVLVAVHREPCTAPFLLCLLFRNHPIGFPKLMSIKVRVIVTNDHISAYHAVSPVPLYSLSTGCHSPLRKSDTNSLYLYVKDIQAQTTRVRLSTELHTPAFMMLQTEISKATNLAL